MTSSEQTTVLLRVQFPDRNLAGPALEDLGRDRSLSVSILRGRITRDDASFELKVTGPMRKIRAFAARSDTWGASVGTCSVDVA